jgi:hypothetical protein
LPHEAFTDFDLTQSHLVLAGATTDWTLCGRRALAFGKEFSGALLRWPRPTAPWCEACLVRYKKATQGSSSPPTVTGQQTVLPDR